MAFGRSKASPIGVYLDGDRFWMGQLSRNGPARIVQGDFSGSAADKSKALRSARRSGKFSGRTAAIALPNSAVCTRPILLPDNAQSQSPADFAKTLQTHCRNVLPFPVEDAVIDYLDLGLQHGDRGNRMSLLVVAAPRAAIDESVAIVSAAGMRTVHVEFAGLSLSRLASPNCLLVELHLDSVSVSAVVDGSLRFTRSINGGLAGMANRLSKTLRVDLEEGLSLLGAIGVEPRGGSPELDYRALASTGLLDANQLREQFASLCATELKTLDQEIRRSIDFFSRQNDAALPDCFFVESIQVPGIHDHLAGRLGRELRPLAPPQGTHASTNGSAHRAWSLGNLVSVGLSSWSPNGNGTPNRRSLRTVS